MSLYHFPMRNTIIFGARTAQIACWVFFLCSQWTTRNCFQVTTENCYRKWKQTLCRKCCIFLMPFGYHGNKISWSRAIRVIYPTDRLGTENVNSSDSSFLFYQACPTPFLVTCCFVSILIYLKMLLSYLVIPGTVLSFRKFRISVLCLSYTVFHHRFPLFHVCS